MGAIGDERDAAPEFWKVWRELLAEVRDPRTVVLVEGVRDRRALEALGVRRSVQLVHRGQPLAEVAGSFGASVREVIVLTDWDAAGGEFARRLRDLLSGGPARVNLDFRRRIGVALRGEIVHLEGLAAWAGRRSEEEGLTLEERIERETDATG
jgi:5S rRNA maturation endonuclease (ribonuclease M5)